MKTTKPRISILSDVYDVFQNQLTLAIKLNLSLNRKMVSHIIVHTDVIMGEHPMVVVKNNVKSTCFLDFDSTERFGNLTPVENIAEAIREEGIHECPICHKMMIEEVNGVCADTCAYKGFHVKDHKVQVIISES